MDIKSTGLNPNNININKADQKQKQNPLGSKHNDANQGLNAEGSVKVNVSQHAKDINKIKQVATLAPDVDQAKVQKFKELINSGKYKMDAKAIADKMVDEEIMMSKLEN